MKPRLSRIFRKSDLKAVIAGDSETFLFYDICSKSTEIWPDGLPRMRALWHYKMYPFGTSAGTLNGNQASPKKGDRFFRKAHIPTINSSDQFQSGQDGTKAQLP